VFYKIWGIPRFAGQLLASQEPDFCVQFVAGRNLYKEMQGDQKVSVHLTITVQSSGAQRLFDHSVF
jgi:hypothetical protein